MAERPGRGPWPPLDGRTPRARLAFLDALAADAAHDQVLQRIARAACDAAPRELRADAVLAATHALAVFVPDPCPDCYQTPRYTLARGAGDCNALACLFVALARAAGLRAWTAWLDQRPKPLDHVAALVDDGRGPRWAEPSVRGARVGEDPRDAGARVALIPPT